MSSIEATPRYRNFSNNMPTSTNPTPRATSSLITIEKEPERDPEEDCFMCRQAHVYIKPIGMQQERRVARRHPPPLTRAQIDELSRKKHLTKLEVRKLLQCYFPEIKDVKYFQLHKYHSCCYDPQHLSLCKNHITALQHERGDHPGHHHGNENMYKDSERQNAQPNKVSFVRIKIEPTKGIPTRFLGPTALPDSLADMLLKQVNRFESKKAPPFDANHSSKPRRVNNPYGTDADDDDDDDDDDEDEDGTDDDDNKQGKAKLRSVPSNGDLVVEDLDELNRLYVNHDGPHDHDNNRQLFSKPLKKKKRKKGINKKTLHGHHKPKLNHWELLALEQAKQEPCSCRHHVMRLEADQVVYDWCRCKDHQHKDLTGRNTALPPPEEPRQPTPPPPPRPRPPPAPQKVRPKPPKVRKKSIGIDATQPATTELALAYDPSAVDYDMIQEVIYYRTSSGRLIKPEVTNAFTYDSMPTDMAINYQEPNTNRSEFLYMTPNGQIQPFEGGGQRRAKNTQRSLPGKPVVLSKPGSLYNGEAYIDTNHSSLHNGTMPVLQLPPSLATTRHNSTDNSRSNGHQPAEFTLARFSPEKSINTPMSLRSPATGSPTKVGNSPIQKSTKPTYSNLEPTPDYGRESSVVANRRWFDQPLGDQNLRPVHDGQYGLIAGTSTDKYQAKSQIPENDYTEVNMPKNGSNCTIS